MSAVPTSSPPTPMPPDPRGPSGSAPAGGAGTRPAYGRGPSGSPRPTTTTFPTPHPLRGQSSAQRLVDMTRDFVTLFLEVESGRRPRKQLERVMTPMLYARLAEIWVRGGQPGQVLRVSLISRDRGFCDLVAIVQRGERCGALSVRLLRVPGGGWVVDVIARPEDGSLPPPAYPVVSDHSEEDVGDIPPVTADAYPPPTDWLVPG